MPTVAETLRQARQANGLSLNQVAEITKIRTDHLRALEEGNYNVFDAPVYIRGFVRTYAKLLKLDVNSVLELLTVELGQTERFSAPPPLAQRKKGILDAVTLQLSKVNWTIVGPILVGLVILVVAVVSYQAWRRHKTADPLATLGSGQYTPRPELNDVYLPVTTNSARR